MALSLRRFSYKLGAVWFNRAMPKMKGHSGAAKRFKRTGGGKLRARHAMTSHNLGKKRPDRKRRLGKPVEVSNADRKRVGELLR
jgi:large subunit ribosomal protein L35